MNLDLAAGAERQSASRSSMSSAGAQGVRLRQRQPKKKPRSQRYPSSLLTYAWAYVTLRHG